MAFVPGFQVMSSSGMMTAPSLRGISSSPAHLAPTPLEAVSSSRMDRFMGLLQTAASFAAVGFAASGVRRAARSRVTRSAVAEAEAPAKAAPKAKAKAKAKAKPSKPAPPLGEQIMTGPWAPLVIAGYAVVGEPFVNKARGKGIALHSRAITAFCEKFGIGNKRRQKFIKTAKSTGHDLGMLVPGGQFGDGLLGQQALEAWEAAGADRW
mmetsp:Transcript_65196/g.155666  ORF Transcript_65196/g.155666 Transcript_65196/m.155666 type:complete len:209 (+) Transcript_65196:146-772(+)|eukprot:CAMPEP_0178414278 /NCGR_PEP_ID=MMETSP0689_2-20121128/22955_1 /TAXON_ID=160604 /ORGANISM="Amphidinium massartii, Strain CS-259" /LENGTH=208 /DNA_ID=CAMNT_0020035565 /DNA_START=88 /DNA_END=714 /DNA_ORIENTATION=+